MFFIPCHYEFSFKSLNSRFVPASCEDHIETRIRPIEEKPLSQQEHQSYGTGSGYKHTGSEGGKDYYDDRQDANRHSTGGAAAVKSHSVLLSVFSCFLLSFMALMR